MWKRLWLEWGSRRLGSSSSSAGNQDITPGKWLSPVPVRWGNVTCPAGAWSCGHIKWESVCCALSGPLIARKKPLEGGIKIRWEGCSVASGEARPAPGAVCYTQGRFLEKSWVHGVLISHYPLVHFHLILGPYSPLHLQTLEHCWKRCYFSFCLVTNLTSLAFHGCSSYERTFAKDACPLSSLAHPILRTLTGYFMG